MEWEGFAVDGLKDGHLGLGFDLVLDALALDPLPDHWVKELITHDRFTTTSNQSVFTHSADPYFRADYLTGTGEKVEAGFSILLVLEGTGSITFEKSDSLSVTRGDALVIPWQSGAWTLHQSQGIVCRPPLPLDAVTAL